MIASRLMYGYVLKTFAVAAICACPAFAQPPDAGAAEVLALEQKIEDAVVRGDVTFVSSVLASDFSFVHGDAWTKGGKPLAEDDRARFLKRVADREYLVHDLDSVQIEMHGDIAITYGRYVSLFIQFLSHRTVHGPTVSPAGVDPSGK